MTYFAVRYTYTDDLAGQDAVRPEHRAFLRELAESGFVVASGPLLGSEPASGLLIVRAESADEVFDTLEADPFKTAQFITETLVEAWNPVIGVFAD